MPTDGRRRPNETKINFQYPSNPKANLIQGPPQDTGIKGTAANQAKTKTGARNDAWDQFIQIMQE